MTTETEIIANEVASSAVEADILPNGEVYCTRNAVQSTIYSYYLLEYIPYNDDMLFLRSVIVNMKFMNCQLFAAVRDWHSACGARERQPAGIQRHRHL